MAKVSFCDVVVVVITLFCGFYAKIIKNKHFDWSDHGLLIGSLLVLLLIPKYFG